MINRRITLLLIALIGVEGAAFASVQAAELKSPGQVKLALRLMMQVANDFDRQIRRKTYARLPHENGEFREASDALGKAIAGEPAAFVAKVTPAIHKALDVAKKVADESGAGDDAQLRAGHAELLKAVNEVFGFFPQALRPDPNVQPGGRPPAPTHAGE